MLSLQVRTFVLDGLKTRTFWSDSNFDIGSMVLEYNDGTGWHTCTYFGERIHTSF